MSRTEFLLQLDDMLELESGTLKGPEKLADLSFDSMATLSFIALADEQFGLSVEPVKVAECETVDCLLALVSDKLS